MEPLKCDICGQEDMVLLFYIRNTCVQLFRSNHAVRRFFIEVERHLIHNIMGKTQFEAGNITNYSLQMLSLAVVNVSEAALSSAGDNNSIQLEAPQLLPENRSFVPQTWLPVNALRDIKNEERVVGLVSYMEHSQFQFDQEEIASMVLRIELLGERHLNDLNPPIKMIFRVSEHTDMDNDSQLLCHYFDEDDWGWKTDGCETVNRNDGGQEHIICHCTHTTPFAVLLVRGPIANIHWKILSYISYIGCGLSAFFTALSLVIYVFRCNPKMDYSIFIHVCLSGALFLLNATFLLTEWGARVKPDWVCVFVAAFMHYSLLCCFTWMAIEALHLYLLLIKVFNTYYKHYLLKLSLAGWGIPGVIIGVSLGVKDFKQFYGVSEMTMADTNQTNAICWITDDSFFYSLNLMYFALIFIFNSGILMAVASSICKMKQVFNRNLKLGPETEGRSWGDSERFSASCRQGLTLMGLTCLMGTSWGLAFLGSGYVNYPILYLFCILNSTQGVFIFLWICLLVNKQRKRDLEDRMSSTPVKTSGVNSTSRPP
ncbi:adhesion G-protein coupled receptor G2 [Embiotoca jacksoni]|uniref:adhesion G-protein coupled receptor G2 n=1 Tax=Embiotoca jacksoni TaxID=100190 RepID=UPI00370436C4